MNKKLQITYTQTCVYMVPRTTGGGDRYLVTVDFKNNKINKR